MPHAVQRGGGRGGNGQAGRGGGGRGGRGGVAAGRGHQQVQARGQQQQQQQAAAAQRQQRLFLNKLKKECRLFHIQDHLALKCFDYLDEQSRKNVFAAMTWPMDNYMNRKEQMRHQLTNLNLTREKQLKDERAKEDYDPNSTLVQNFKKDIAELTSTLTKANIDRQTNIETVVTAKRNRLEVEVEKGITGNKNIIEQLAKEIEHLESLVIQMIHNNAVGVVKRDQYLKRIEKAKENEETCDCESCKAKRAATTAEAPKDNVKSDEKSEVKVDAAEVAKETKADNDEEVVDDKDGPPDSSKEQNPTVNNTTVDVLQAGLAVANEILANGGTQEEAAAAARQVVFDSANKLKDLRITDDGKKESDGEDAENEAMVTDKEEEDCDGGDDVVYAATPAVVDQPNAEAPKNNVEVEETTVEEDAQITKEEDEAAALEEEEELPLPEPKEILPQLWARTDAHTLLDRLNTRRLYNRILAFKRKERKELAEKEAALRDKLDPVRGVSHMFTDQLKEHNEEQKAKATAERVYRKDMTIQEMADKEWDDLLEVANLRNAERPIPYDPIPTKDELLLFSPCPRAVAILASYPRSGNSLMRTMYEHTTLRVTGSDMQGGLAKHDLVGEMAVGTNMVQFVKTHFPERQGTPPFKASRVVLLVRNPFDALESFFNLMMTGTHTNSLSDEVREKTKKVFEEYVLKEIRVWKTFHTFWMQQDVPILLIRYEDLIRDPPKVMSRVIRFTLEIKRMDTFFSERIERCCSEQAEIERMGSYKPRSGGIGKSFSKYSPELFNKLKADKDLKLIMGHLGYKDLFNKPPEEWASMKPLQDHAIEYLPTWHESKKQEKYVILNKGNLARTKNEVTYWNKIKVEMGIVDESCDCENCKAKKVQSAGSNEPPEPPKDKSGDDMKFCAPVAEKSDEKSEAKEQCNLKSEERNDDENNAAMENKTKIVDGMKEKTPTNKNDKENAGSQN